MNKDKYILVDICERDIGVPRIFNTHDEAYEDMRKQLEGVLGCLEDFNEDDDYGLDKNSAWANRSENYDWKIFCLSGGSEIKELSEQEC